jgi:histone acetyltransferase MYST1
LPPLDQHLERVHHEKTKVKNIHVVEFGTHEMDTWYYSPYPEPYANNHKIHICDMCLKYFRKTKTHHKHRRTCPHTSPPGRLIYEGPSTENERGPQIAFFEVDGSEHARYCQSLCLLSKLFLDHKTLYFDVEHFLFYVMCEVEHVGKDKMRRYKLVGYFSKEKHSLEEYNLACIMTLPCYQRRGYGRALISMSYELSKKEGKAGSPEKPLSDLGLVSYRSYWLRTLLETLREHRGQLTMRDLGLLTSIKTDDIVNTLQPVNLVKYWKSQYILNTTPRIIDEHLKTFERQKVIRIDGTKMDWSPRQFPLPSYLAKVKKPRTNCGDKHSTNKLRGGASSSD